jgi:hypothetical protein
MSTTQHTAARATFEVKTWDEKPYSELDGEGTMMYLMFYPSDGSASFVGLEHVIGRLSDRAGSFVLHHTGADDGVTTKSTYFVVPGSGTGDLRGLRGEGSSVLSRNTPQFTMSLDYDFE